MEAATTANIISAGALAVAAFVAIRAERSSRANSERADQADEAAERSADAARRSAEAAEKSLEFEERATAAAERTADQFGEFLSRQEKRDQRQWSSRDDMPSVGDRARGGGPWMGPPSGQPAGGRPEPVVHWTVDKIRGRIHHLKNLGQATAYDVQLRSNNAVRFDGPEEPRDMDVGEVVEFFAAGSWQTGTPELIVNWRDEPDGERREWRRPVP